MPNIFIEIHRLGDIRLGLNSIVEFNSLFFWFDSLVKVSYLSKGHIVTALVQLLSCVWLFATLWIAKHQASCPSPTPGACSNSCPLSQWCYPTISSSVVPFSSWLQSFPAWGSFPMSQFFTSGGQSTVVWALASVLPMNVQDWFPLGLTGLISWDSSRVFSNITVQKHQLFGPQLSS